MTVPVQVIFTSSTANGTTTVFPYSFKITDSADLEVSLNAVVQTSGYTVSGVGETAGGNVTFTTAPANGVTVLRALNPILKRVTDYQQFGDWMAATVNLDFDRMWLTLQKFANDFKRALKLPVDTATDQLINSTPTQRADTIIGFNSLGNLYTLALSAIPVTVSAASFTVDTFSGTGAQTAFTLSRDPGIKNNTSVYVGGVYLRKDQYEVSGTTLTFDVAPAAGTDNIEVTQSVALIANSPADGTVTVNSFSAAGLAALPASITYTQSGTGAVSRNVQAKLREYVSDTDFGTVGDGVTNDTTALTNFFNSAIANPGIPHRIRRLTFAITAQLPTINVSNVIIECPGVDTHDVGSIFNGAVIKWTGAAGGTMQQIVSVSGAGNQKISNIKLNGIAYDANSLAANGVFIQSIWNSDIQIGVANATATGLTLGVVGALGEARDLQRNRIRFIGRQIEAPGGVALRLQGDTTANVSMNDLWVDISHKNTAAIVSENADNNDWWFIRTNRVTGGTATDAISWLGGTTEPLSTREERIHFLSSNITSQAYGTATYAVGAQKIRIFTIDTGNATPAPTVGAGASVFWNRADTPFGDTPWETATPTITSATGALTTVSATRRHLKRGTTCFFEFVITITTNGTGATSILAPLPFAEGPGKAWVCAGKETAVTGAMQMGIITGGSSNLSITGYDGLYSGGNGRVININGFYEVA